MGEYGLRFPEQISGSRRGMLVKCFTEHMYMMNIGGGTLNLPQKN